MIKIIGANGNIKNLDDFLKKVDNFSFESGLTIQVFNSDVIYGKDHIISAVEHARRSIARKTNTTKSFEKEILLYAAGERQLKLAIPKMGVKEGVGNIAFVFINDSKNEILEKTINDLLKKLNLTKDDNVLNGNKNTLEMFGISEDEIKTVNKSKYGHIILEKVAMVDIIK
jgi:KEOPS complex subunit Cgi121